MLKELGHHVVVHISQHPKESAAAAVAAGKVVAPVLLTAAPFVAGAILVAGIFYGIKKL